MNDDKDKEFVRLSLTIAEDKEKIGELEGKVEALQEVVEKQNALIETLWELYTLGSGNDE